MSIIGNPILLGGSGGSAPNESIRFLDYDGTVLHTYEVGKLKVLPPLPAHAGLISQGWNWSLEDIQALDRAMDVGPMYITDDGKTRLYITVMALDLRRTVYFSQDVDSGVAIDWGDGSAEVTVSGTGNLSATHEYAALGEYMITLLPAEGCTLGLGNGTYSTLVVQEHVRLHRAEIGRGVTSIGDHAFGNCYGFQSVTIPNGVTSIGDHAFSGCNVFRSVTIPASVTSIGNDAFSTSYGLQSIAIPASVTSIGNNAFSGCYALRSITIPDSVTSMGNYVFSSCYLLQSITIPDSVTSMGNYVFSNCYLLQSITIPHTVISIGNYTFEQCLSLQRITIPDSVMSIGNLVFRYCDTMAIYDFTAHTAVPTLGTSAFYPMNVDCEIRVPAALYDAWVAAANWSSYAANIVAV